MKSMISSFKTVIVLVCLVICPSFLKAQVDYVKRINCGDSFSAVYEGETFEPDETASGISYDGEYTTEGSSSFTLSQPHKSIRYTKTSSMYYKFPVENGDYRVILHFAEPHHGVASGTDPETRKFNWDIESQVSRTDYNIMSEAGGANMIKKEDHTVNVIDGELTLTFSKGIGNDPIINAIEVLGVSTPPPPPSSTEYWTQSGTNLNYADGNVGIGMPIPDSKLAVNGNIHAREVKVDVHGWPDYVFTSDYPLPTIKEVANHIATKGHLINIPPAHIIENDGLYIGQMNKLLLEKIEELTLYILQHNEILESQNRAIQDLKQLHRKTIFDDHNNSSTNDK